MRINEEKIFMFLLITTVVILFAIAITAFAEMVYINFQDYYFTLDKSLFYMV